VHADTKNERSAKAPLDCAWCHDEFPHIVELLAHVDERHLPTALAPRAA
jgi:hypothetical protein